ncbi:MAG: hypothetical protein HFJ53_06480 [Clostridia bacterium]|jgi:BirA family biotin operon repressor/biotin-[acetyl-CoA-carboxylase] ligase|nr:hypothetical protein [Clostridia bacterium]
MDIEKIKKAKTKLIGKEIIYYDKIASTQEEAKKIVKDDSKNGTIVITDHQTNGIGTKGKTWYSNKEKNITMTIILKSNCTIDKLQRIDNKNSRSNERINKRII